MFGPFAGQDSCRRPVRIVDAKHSFSVSEDVMEKLLENKPTQNFEESLNGFLRSWTILNGDLPVDEEMAGEYTERFRYKALTGVEAWSQGHASF